MASNRERLIAWHARASELVAFRARHGRWPDGALPGERKLSMWRAAQQRSFRRGTMPEGTQAWLDRWIPGWNPSADEEFLELAIRCGAFFAEHGRWPRSKQPERRLYLWLQRNREMFLSGELDIERSRILDKHCPRWNSGASDVWEERARQLADHLLAHGGAFPNRELGGVHRALYQWTSTQRQAFRGGSLPLGRKNWLDEHCPGWREAGIWGAAAVSPPTGTATSLYH